MRRIRLSDERVAQLEAMAKRHSWENGQCLKCGADKRHEQMMARKYDGAMSPCPSWAYKRNVVTGELQQR